MLLSSPSATTNTFLGADFDKYLPIANALALLFVAIYTRIYGNKAVVTADEAKKTAANTTEKLEVVHKLVNNAAMEQQKKVDELEKELRELRFIMDRMRPPQ